MYSHAQARYIFFMSAPSPSIPSPAEASASAASSASAAPLREPRRQPEQSGWLMVAAATVLCCVVAVITALSVGRNESAMAQLLAEKGAALIRAVEGGLRTGMRTQVGVQLQAMLQEMAGSDVLFLAVTMPDGTILAHSKPGRVGEVLEVNGSEADERLLRALLETSDQQDVRWFITTMEGKRSFVVYRDFMPPPPRPGMHGTQPRPLIFLGLDVSPFEITRAQDRNHLIMLAGGLLLFGIASLVAIYYAQRARESRRRQKLAEGQVRVLEEEMRRKEKMAAIGNLAAGVAHEIRNPLSSIKGYATYFGQRFAPGSDDREAAQVMVREVDRLNRVITDLIGLSRPTDVRLAPTEALPVLEHVLRLLRQDAESHGVTVHLESSDTALPAVALDADRFGQALLNVCLNAIEAMPEGGELALSLRAHGAKHVCIEVRDTGTGILPKDLTHIFDPYFTTKGHGTGLGLATVHKIVEAHEGEVRVTSRHHSEGQPSGTVFQFILPIAGGAA